MTDRRPAPANPREPPGALPDDGILLGYSLEHERRTAPIGFTYGVRNDVAPDARSPTLDPMLHTGGGHLMTIAPTGGGKGVGCIIPTLLRFPGPVIVIDPKGENYAVTAERRRELGQKVVVLDPIGITGADAGSLNPLDLVDPSDAQSIDDAAALASLLTGGVEKEDPRNLFWYQRGEQLLTGLIQLVAVTRPREKRHLGEVRRLLNLPTEQFVEMAQKEMATCADPDVRQTAGTLVNPAQEMIGSILGMSQNSLGFLRGELLHESTADSTFPLEAVTAGDPLSVFIVIPPDKLESHRNLLRLWIGMLMSGLMRRRAPVPHPTLLVLDEAAQLGPLEQLRQAITLMRGYGLQTWSFWQDVSQLQNLYPRDWETMYNNCRVHQAFGFTTLRGAETACALLGFHDPVEALRLDADEMILSVSGDEAVIAQKPNYLTDPAFEGLYAPNPFYEKSRERPPVPRRPRRVYVRPAVVASRPEPTGDDEEEVEAPAATAHERPPELPTARIVLDETAVSTDDADEGPGTAGDFATALAPLPDVSVVEAARAPAFLNRVEYRLRTAWSPVTTQIRRIDLPFHGGSHLYELLDPDRVPGRALIHEHGAELSSFHGGRTAVEELARRFALKLRTRDVAEYLRFVFHFGRPFEPPLRLVETARELRHWTGCGQEETEGYLEYLAPIDVQADEDGDAAIRAVALAGTDLVELRGELSRSGQLTNVTSSVLATNPAWPAGYPAVGLVGEATDGARFDVLLEAHGVWETLARPERRTVAYDLPPDARGEVMEAPSVLRRALRCYPSYSLLRVDGNGEGPAVWLHRPGEAHPVVAGGGDWLAKFNEGRLVVEDALAAAEYLRLFAWLVTSSDHYSMVLDRFEQLPLASGAADSEVIDRLRAGWRALRPVARRHDDPDRLRFRFEASLLENGTVSFAELFVLRGGRVGMDENVERVGPLTMDPDRLGALLALPALGPWTTRDVPGWRATPRGTDSR